MRRFLLLAACLASSGAGAGIPEEQYGELSAAFDALAGGYTQEAADTVAHAMLGGEWTARDWHTFYADYFADRDFTGGHAVFWTHAIRAREGEAEHAVTLAQASCQFAAMALAAADDRIPRDLDLFARVLEWLERTGRWLGGEQIGPARETVTAVFAERPINAGAMLGTGAQGTGDPRAAQLGMQACLTLSLFVDGARMAGALTLPRPLAAFHGEHGIFVFDGGLLSEAHWASLASLFASVPPALHQVAAVLVPEGAGHDAASAQLATPGLVLDIPAVPMDLLSEPAEFIPRVGYRTAPEFTLGAAVQLVRAIQHVQFGLRPGLGEWRDAIAVRAGARQSRYLRRGVPPAAYLADPDELLPLTAYLWFLDSERAFFQAMELMKVKESEALDAVLLLADLLSGGGGETLLFQTDPAGIVHSLTTLVQRTPAAPGLAIVTGFALRGEFWTFELNDNGGVMRYFNRRAGSVL